MTDVIGECCSCCRGARVLAVLESVWYSPANAPPGSRLVRCTACAGTGARSGEKKIANLLQENAVGRRTGADDD